LRFKDITGSALRYKTVLILSFISVIVRGQLSSPEATSVRFTSYPSSLSIKDPIFFFCNSTGTERGNIEATRHNGSGVYDFRWYQWNSGTNSFSTLLKTETGVSVSLLDNLLDGGYKVEIDSGGVYDTSLVGWIFFDKPPVSHAHLQQQLCDRIALSGDTISTIKKFYYNDINTGSPVLKSNELTFLWSSDPLSLIPYPSLYLLKVIDSPPLDDVTYKLTVNSLGCSDDTSFFVTSIKVKADFTVDPDKGEAPLKVTFTDKSIRGTIYKWEFGDDSLSALKDPGIHTYYRPGEYIVKLSIESDIHCTDEMTFDKIFVDPSELNIPNVFTPDGDALNDKFIVESKSLRRINVEIFSRSGMRVYYFSGEGQALAEWNGWDGNVNNSSAKAAPGVYFYVIRATGWDDIVYDGKLYRGVVYLYR
jgi:gliding motility-associated-like protein